MRLDKRLKKSVKEQQENQISLENEKQKNRELVIEQQTLVKELRALQAAVAGAETERDALGRALKDANDTHEDEKSKLVKKLILEEQQDKPHQQVGLYLLLIKLDEICLISGRKNCVIHDILN